MKQQTKPTPLSIPLLLLCLLLCLPFVSVTLVALSIADAPVARGQNNAANSTAENNTAENDTAGNTAERIETQCRALVTPGTGDDTAARKQIHATVILATKAADLREATLEGFRKFLEDDTTPVAARHFVLEQLAWISTNDSARWIARHLDTPELCSVAVQALVASGSINARSNLHIALERVTDVPGRVAILDGLGQLGYDEVALTLMHELDHGDDRVRMAALRSLSKIGSADAAALIGRAMQEQSWYEQSEATALLLRLGRRVGAEDKGSAASLFRGLLQLRRNGNAYSHIRCAALDGLAETIGAGALDDVLNALSSEDAEVSATARRLAVGMKGTAVTRELVDRLGRGTASWQCATIQVIADRGDRVALPGVTAALQHTEARVRIAAARALATLGAETEVAPLAAAHEATTHRGEKNAIRSALTRLYGADVDFTIAKALNSASDTLRSSLLRVLADRWDGKPHPSADPRDRQASLQLVAPGLTSPDSRVRLATLKALGSFGRDAAIGIATHLEHAAGPELNATQRALVKSLQGADSLLLKRTLARCHSPVSRWLAAMPVFAELGAAESFPLIVKSCDSSDPATATAAYRALGRWSNGSQAEEILAIARRTDEPKHHGLAMRAFANLAGADPSRSPDAQLDLFQRLALLERGLDVAKRSDDRKMILAKLADLGTARALPIIERAANDPSLVDEVAAAKLRVAETLLPGGWQESLAICDALLGTSSNERIRERARAIRAKVVRYDAVTAWSVAGPFRAEGQRGNATLTVPFALEKKQPVEWKPHLVTAGDRYWFIDLTASLGSGENCAGYLYTNLVSDETRDVVLELGSDDGLRVWLRGEMVHENPAYRGCQEGQDRVPVRLRAGDNPVLLKVSNGGGGWGATLRIRHADGTRVDGVRADATPPTTPPKLASGDNTPEGKIRRAAPEAAQAKPKRARTLLVFTLTRGYRHGSIPTGTLAMKVLGEKSGAYHVVHSEDIAMFEKPALDQFDAVCFLSTTGELFTHPNLDKLDAPQRAAALARQRRLEANLVDFVKAGKGLIGIHAATDTLYQLPAYGEMIGGYFDGHPWHEKVGVTVEEPDHPLLRGFEAPTFDVTDEIYQMKAPYSRFQQRVLMSLDKARTNMKKDGIRRKDGDFPISWVKRFGQGRVFYCSLGHRDEIFWNAPVLRHYLAGIQYALGDLDAPDAPRK